MSFFASRFVDSVGENLSDLSASVGGLLDSAGPLLDVYERYEQIRRDSKSSKKPTKQLDRAPGEYPTAPTPTPASTVLGGMPPWAPWAIGGAALLVLVVIVARR